MAAPSSLRLVVHGAAGRMGRRVVGGGRGASPRGPGGGGAAADSRVQLVAALDRAGGPHSADDAGVLAEVG
jgi:dihydrodipicolinate reductase